MLKISETTRISVEERAGLEVRSAESILYHRGLTDRDVKPWSPARWGWMSYRQKAPARSTQAPLTRTEFLAVCIPQRSCNKCLLSCALPIQPPVMSRRRREALRKERGIDLGPAPYSKGDCTAAAYWLFHSPSIITFDSPRFSWSAAIFHTSFTVQSQSAISLESGMPLSSAAWCFSTNTPDNICYLNCSERFVMSRELYLSSVYSSHRFTGFDLFDWGLINILCDFITLGQIGHEHRSSGMFGKSVERVNAFTLQDR